MKHHLRDIAILAALLFVVSVFLIPKSEIGGFEDNPTLLHATTIEEFGEQNPTAVHSGESLSETTSATSTAEDTVSGENVLNIDAQHALPTYVEPVLLAIDSIGVYAPIDQVGVSGKAMAVPSNSTDVGWYEFGVRPGNIGTAVLAGHVNWYGGKDAVFTNLHLLAIGDVIRVIDAEGKTSQFVVRDIQQYPLQADTSEVFVSDDGGAHLNLITCDGPWNELMGTHEQRLVIFTDKIQGIEIPAEDISPASLVTEEGE